MIITRKIIIQCFAIFILLFVFGCKKKKVVKVYPDFEGYWEELAGPITGYSFCRNVIHITKFSSGSYDYCSPIALTEGRETGKFHVEKDQDILYIGDAELSIDVYPHYVTQEYWFMELDGIVYFAEKTAGAVALCDYPEFCITNNTNSDVTGSFQASTCCFNTYTIQPGEQVCVQAVIEDDVFWNTNGSSLIIGGVIGGCKTLYSID